MPRIFLYLYVLFFFFSFGCQQSWKSEKEEAAFWNQKVIDPAHKLLYAQEAIEPALKHFDSLAVLSGIKSPYIEAARFILIANYHYFISKEDASTASAVDAALDILQKKELTDRYPATYVGNLLFGGQIAYRLHQYNKASDYYFKAKRIADAHLEPCDRKAFNYSIAMLLYKQQNFAASIHYFRQAYDMQSHCAVQGAVVLQQQEIQSNIGLCQLQLKKYDSALLYFEKALRIAEQHKSILGPEALDKIHGVIYGNKAKVYLARNELSAAETFSLKSIALNARPQYEIMDAQKVQLQLADVYRRQSRMAAMYTLLAAVRQGLDTIRNDEAELEWRRLKSLYYKATDQPLQELSYFKSYAALKDSVLAHQNRLRNEDITRQLREKDQVLRIGLLTKNNQFSHTLLWLALIVAILLLAIVILVYLNSRRHKKGLAYANQLNEEIRFQKAAREQESRKHHRQITEAVIQAQEGERSQIGLELHDNVNQVLTTVKLMNEMVLQGVGDAPQLLTRSSHYLQNCINEIRNLSRRLSAPTLGQISLEESVADLLDSINTTGQLQITQSIQGLSDKTLKQELHLGVYRIIQEQLNNVIKHAEASRVWVALDQDEAELRLLIRDNGKGFHTGQKRKGIGLVNIQTRAETLNGKFALKSEPGKGCRLEVVFPLDNIMCQ